jgi:hypothetical protein
MNARRRSLELLFYSNCYSFVCVKQEISSIKQIYPNEYDKIIKIIQNEVINSLAHRDTNDFKEVYPHRDV